MENKNKRISDSGDLKLDLQFTREKCLLAVQSQAIIFRGTRQEIKVRETGREEMENVSSPGVFSHLTDPVIFSFISKK